MLFPDDTRVLRN